MPVPDKKKFDRDITYQVGWKKGKIHVQEPASTRAVDSTETPPVAAVTSLYIVEQQSAPAGGRLLAAMWKSLPYPSYKAVFLCSAILPVAAFAAVVWLVSKLSQG